MVRSRRTRLIEHLSGQGLIFTSMPVSFINLLQYVIIINDFFFALVFSSGVVNHCSNACLTRLSSGSLRTCPILVRCATSTFVLTDDTCSWFLISAILIPYSCICLNGSLVLSLQIYLYFLSQNL